jgi:NADPH:quinone reductase-like Zn-dependent oxidoreductase
MGETMPIHAEGSVVGTAAIQLAKLVGAFTMATAGSPEKLSKAADLGLDVGINYRKQDFAQVVQEHTNGKGVEVILDVVGGPYWERNLASLAEQGRMVVVSTLGGGEVEVNLRSLMPKRLRVSGTVLRARSPGEKLTVTRQFARHVLLHLVRSSLHPVIDRVFPLEQVSQARRYMERNANFGKIVLEIG